MWRGATASICSKLLLSSRAACCRPSDTVSGSHVLSSPVINDILPKGALFSAQFNSNSVAGSWKLGPTPTSHGLDVDSPVEVPFLRSPIATFLASKQLLKASDSALHYGRCYWELSKAKLSMLVVATSGAGFVLGSGTVIDLVGLCCTCVGTMTVAAAANSLNQVFEVHNDAKMKRTRNRPLPSGRLSVPHAVAWASSVGVGGTVLLASKTNLLAAGLAASNLALYAFVYTPLKQIHPVNTWVGAVVGAIPPLLGWAAATGEISPNGLILPAALYFWQIPHFMALAYFCRSDYAAGGFKMFSLYDASGWRTSLVSLRNCLYLFPAGYLAYHWGVTSGWFAVESSILTGCMTAAAVAFVLDRTPKKARRMFHASLIYLPVFMAGLLLHRLPNEQEAQLADSGDSHGRLLSASEARSQAEGDRPLPPVAYASAAPFPFLPAPLYAPPDP
ncbi:unnamed protein product [Spirodela intermedia]|uniref:Heme O synthase n=1 Tax=Spirodela intermedia TaxID=51605 RepID=A0A7I8IHV3_SPIIN|nr:unnamed protein product [Spirodela intermedia]CAA6656663.1 unnamed protein product [Spirodela intermedia]